MSKTVMFIHGAWLTPASFYLFRTRYEDRTIVPSMVRATYNTQRRAPAVTAFKSFPGRSHFPMAEPGWEEIADYAIRWASEHARQVELRSNQYGFDYGSGVVVRS